MHATYEAAANVADASVAMLREALAGLPGAALDWTPASGMSSVAVLVTHSAVATLAWAGVGAGVERSQETYREHDRAAAFRARGQSVEALLALLEPLPGDLRALFAAAAEGTLERETAWVDEGGRRLTGVECLFRAVAHLREHVGHVQLMRDLWLAGSREGR